MLQGYGSVRVTALTLFFIGLSPLVLYYIYVVPFNLIDAFRIMYQMRISMFIFVKYFDNRSMMYYEFRLE